MDFLDISSLGTTYRYVVKIEQKLKQKTQKFGSREPLTAEVGKGQPQPTKQRKRKDGQPQDNQSNLTNKEGQWEDKERHWEVVQVP
jgi:hypothetical protein